MHLYYQGWGEECRRKGRGIRIKKKKREKGHKLLKLLRGPQTFLTSYLNLHRESGENSKEEETKQKRGEEGAGEKKKRAVEKRKWTTSLG